jgi:hypothetical protein
MANYRIRRDIQSKGGLARALSMSPRRRKQIARAAAKARWRAAKPQMAVKAKQDVQG